MRDLICKQQRLGHKPSASFIGLAMLVVYNWINAEQTDRPGYQMKT